MPQHLTARQKRKARIRVKVSGTAQRPRLSVYRSLKHIYAQLIDDSTGNTIACAGTNSKSFKSEVVVVAEAPPPVAAKAVEVQDAPADVVAVAAPGKKGDKKGDAGKKGGDAAKKGDAGKKGEAAAKKAAPASRKVVLAKRVGAALAKVAKAKGVEKIVFDRNGFDYHGRVAAVAQGARDSGLKF